MPIYAAAGGKLIIAEIEDITVWRSVLNSVQLRKIREASSAEHPTPSGFVYDTYTGDVIPSSDPYRPFLATLGFCTNFQYDCAA